ncbi:NADH-quinone oxidoreductase subunit A [Fundidesulfovibrio putealis]|jgi:NADH-quinone oxidoreductase subunit A|uniref:NADH-quinone oxidoreductase subunit A n=1 Tax=Fundidesulfovibrio putealis TaxID=270496 RepID=UPI00047FD14F|nr:NADH-quinone oxidoreductase subunit A [Fundidesulfovibrio putealis]
MVFTWLNVAVFACLAAGIAFAAGPLAASYLLAPRTRGGAFAAPYECGMIPRGQAWTRFGINYSLYALIFLSFDVDVLYLFPVAAHYPHSQGWGPFIAVALFVAVLAMAMVYFQRKGVFTWPRRIQ